MFRVFRLDLSAIWSGLRQREGPNDGLRAPRSPRPAELSELEAEVLGVLARTGDYRNFAGVGRDDFLMKKGRRIRGVKFDALDSLVRRIDDPNEHLGAPAQILFQSVRAIAIGARPQPRADHQRHKGGLGGSR